MAGTSVTDALTALRISIASIEFLLKSARTSADIDRQALLEIVDDIERLKPVIQAALSDSTADGASPPDSNDSAD